MNSRIYPNAKYSFDTSAFIEPWRRHYPPDIFESLWDFITNHIESEIIIATIMVRTELERQHDNLLRYVKKFSNLFKTPMEREQDVVKLILNDRNYEHWKIGDRHKADPFIVAIAKVHKLCVVTYEDQTKNGKIPSVCRDYDVDCCGFLDFLKREGLKI